MELSEIRKEIDAVDDELLSLFEKRMALSAMVAAQKKERALPLVNEAREKEILDRMEKKAEATAPYVKDFFIMLFDASKDFQSRLLQ